MYEIIVPPRLLKRERGGGVDETQNKWFFLDWASRNNEVGVSDGLNLKQSLSSRMIPKFLFIYRKMLDKNVIYPFTNHELLYLKDSILVNQEVEKGVEVVQQHNNIYRFYPAQQHL